VLARQLRPLAVDFETELIGPACLAPAPACLTWQVPGEDARICDAIEARHRLREWLEDPWTLFIGANTAFDMGVAAEAYPELRRLIFKAYGEDRVTDVQIRDRLLNIARGTYMGRFGKGGLYVKHKYRLLDVAERNAGIILQKDEWRLSYGKFIGVPLSQWTQRAIEVQAEARVTLSALEAEWAETKPKDIPSDVKERLEGLRLMIASDPRRCTEYPLDDSRATLASWEAQEAHKDYLHNEFDQARGYLALHLSSAWGLRTDAQGVETLKRETQAAYDDVKQELVEAGLVRTDGTRDTKAAKRLMLDVCAREGLAVRRTDAHSAGGKCKKLDGTPLADQSDDCEEHVCLDEDACNATEDDLLITYAEFGTLTKVLSNDVEALSQGLHLPIHTHYSLAETGRTTSSKPNIQNLRRRPGIREAFVPRAGNVFAEADYPSVELYTLAQCCVSWIGQSKLAEALNAGLDPHLWFAASMLGISYDEAKANKKREDVKKARQLAKAANFGFPGGMGVAKFVKATRKQIMSNPDKAAARAEWEALGLDEARAKQLKEEWFAAWPEMPHYFARINALCANDSGKAFVESLFTKRFRGGATYCSACNNGFQGLASDAAKRALWLVAHAQYVEPESPLFNSRTVAFVHDELIVECADDERAHDVAHELARVMVVGANEYLPDVPIKLEKMEPLLMRRWSKNAEPRHDSQGRLVPWE